MKFFLTSTGLTNESITRTFRSLLPRPAADCRVAFIPTAANIYTETDWLDEDIRNIENSGIGSVDNIDIASLEQSDWLRRCRAADVIWFNGGDTSYLLDCVRKSGMAEELSSLLSSRLYVGSSAGSMIAGPSIESISLFPEEDEFEVENQTGLDLVPFAIIPHLNSDSFHKTKSEYIEQFAKKVDYPVYALDDNSAVLSIDGAIELISEGKTWGI